MLPRVEMDESVVGCNEQSAAARAKFLAQFAQAKRVAGRTVGEFRKGGTVHVDRPSFGRIGQQAVARIAVDGLDFHHAGGRFLLIGGALAADGNDAQHLAAGGLQAIQQLRAVMVGPLHVVDDQDQRSDFSQFDAQSGCRLQRAEPLAGRCDGR